MALKTSQAGSPAIVLVSSAKDPASANMAKALRTRHGFEPTGISLMGRPVYQRGSMLLVTMESDIVEPPDLDGYFNPLAYIFLSKHRAESGIPSLTVHTTGNFTSEQFLGARPKEVGRVDPDLQKNYFISLHKRSESLEGYELTVEATHHGPTNLQRPVLFVELGSSEKNWGDEHAAEVIGEALVDSLEGGRSWEKVAIAFGGTHYPKKVNELLLDGDMAVASIVPKRWLEFVDAEMFGQLIQKSVKFPRFVAIDWKGMGGHKERILGLAKQFALEVVKL